MAKQNALLRRLLDESSLPEESLPRETVLELLGDGRVLIEHHGGVSEYTPTKIRIHVRYGAVDVLGCNLRLREMSAHKLVITGKIEQICLDRRPLR